MTMPNRELTLLEKRVLRCAMAIDRLEKELRNVSARVDVLVQRDDWIDSYLAHDPTQSMIDQLRDL